MLNFVKKEKKNENPFWNPKTNQLNVFVQDIFQSFN